MRGTANAERLAQAKRPFVFAAVAVALWGNARIIRHPLERVSVSRMRGREDRQEPLITTQHRTVSASDRLLDACAAGDAKRIRSVLDEHTPQADAMAETPLNALLRGMRQRKEQSSNSKHEAVEQQYAAAARELLRDAHFGDRFAAARAGIHHVDPIRGGGPLHAAARADSPLLIQILIDAGADTEAGNFSIGGTALHQAVKCSQLQVCEVLVAGGSNPFALDADGETPVDLSEMDHVHSQVYAFLKQVRRERAEMDHYGPSVKAAATLGMGA